MTEQDEWIDYILFMLKGYRDQAKSTKELLLKTVELFESYKGRVREKNPKVYSADLVEILFMYPMISADRLSQGLGIHYRTANRYLKSLEKSSLLVSTRVGKYHLYANKELIDILNHGVSSDG